MSKHSVTKFIVILTIQYSIPWRLSLHFLTEYLSKVGTFMKILLSDPTKSGLKGGAWIDGYDYQNKDKKYHYEK